jgi:ubiquinone/menaquinone biosynthesis C-methylase UbiE
MLNSRCWSAMNCVLDLGCGTRLTPQKLDLPQTWRIIGLDVNEEALRTAHEAFPNRVFVRGAGESMPFAHETFWRIFPTVAVPHMHIPEGLAEMTECFSLAVRLS